VDSKTNRTAWNSSFGMLQEVEMKSHLSVKFMAKSIGIFVNNEITSSQMRENSSSICVFFSFFTNSKLFPMLL